VNIAVAAAHVVPGLGRAGRLTRGSETASLGANYRPGLIEEWAADWNGGANLGTMVSKMWSLQIHSGRLTMPRLISIAHTVYNG
jgi:hypothetical protein